MLLCVSTPRSCACSACSLWRIYSAMTAIQLTLVRHLLEADDYICSSPVALLHYCPVATLCCPPWPLTRLHHHNPAHLLGAWRRRQPRSRRSGYTVACIRNVDFLARGRSDDSDRSNVDDLHQGNTTLLVLSSNRPLLE